jgi:hypothetical protein
LSPPVGQRRIEFSMRIAQLEVADERPEEHREQDDGRRQSERGAADARLDSAADDELGWRSSARIR